MKAIIIEDKDVHALVEKLRMIGDENQLKPHEPGYTASDAMFRKLWYVVIVWLQDHGATVNRQ